MKMKQQVPCLYGDSLPADLDQAYTEALLITQAKAWVYYSVLVSTKVVWTDALPTAGTDGGFVYINPAFFLSLPNAKQRAFLLAHEVGHIVLKHPLRGKFFEDRGFHTTIGNEVIPWNHKMYNNAGDYVINADLVAHGFEPIPSGLFDARFDRDDLVDSVYVTLHREQEAKAPEPEGGDEGPCGPDGYPGDEREVQPGESEPEDGEDDADAGEASGEAGDEDGEAGDETGDNSAEGDADADDAEGGDADGDDGEAGDTEGDASDDKSDGNTDGDADGDDADGENGSPKFSEHDGHDVHMVPQYEGSPEEQAEAEAEDRAELERTIDEALDALEDMPEDEQPACGPSGNVSGAGYRHQGSRDFSNINWSEEIMDELTKSGRGGNSNWSKPSVRRYATMGIIAPTFLGAVDCMVGILDISGSVNRVQLRKALERVAEAVDMLQPSDGIYIAFVNHQFVDYVHCTDGQGVLDVVVPTGGGTYMSAGLYWIEEMGLTPDVTFCFTDGEMLQEDWDNMASHDVLMVLDSPDNWWAQRCIRNESVPSRVVCVQ